MSEPRKIDKTILASQLSIQAFRCQKAHSQLDMPLQLRAEQLNAVNQTYNYYQKCRSDKSLPRTFLWNAKPRFGKTFAAYSFAAKIRASKILVVTNRPAIVDSWYSDLQKFDFEENLARGKQKNDSDSFRWIFTSSIAVKRRLGKSAHVYTRSEQIKSQKLLRQNFIHFISLQDIKGCDLDGYKRKNSWIFDIGQDSNGGWDLIIIDESHEGADTVKALQVFTKGRGKFTLYLSGTPFKNITQRDFSDEQIFNWSYSDEQEQKVHWSNVNLPNPYADLPEMQIFTYQLSRMIGNHKQLHCDNRPDYDLDFTELFKVGKVNNIEQFVHEKEVRQFINKLSDVNGKYPFSQSDSRESLRHTFWLLPGVKACEHFKQLLLEDEYFRQNYRPEDIILAAGRGDDDRITHTALSEVNRRIGQHPLNTRTITLSCGQLTAGVTIPAWTAVFILNNSRSPSLYMQSAFRAQNPFWITQNGESYIKSKCYVFDFNPVRALETLSEIANLSYADKKLSHRQKIDFLIKFLPVFAEDDSGQLRLLCTDDILAIPKHLIAGEVISRGFMSNRLFKNISGIFSCPVQLRNIINKLDEAKSGSRIEREAKHKTPIITDSRIWVDRNQSIHINEDIIIGTTHGLFSGRRYIEAGTSDAEEINSILNEAVIRARQAGYSVTSAVAVKESLRRKLPKIVQSIPGIDIVSDEYAQESADPSVARAKTAEDRVRDRLRGFARTIPSLLMAYGSPSTRLSNFGDDVPDEIFEELTGITKDEFYKLRDGMDYESIDETGKSHLVHFDGFFDEEVFNYAIQEFYVRRNSLAKYYLNSVEDDIFSVISPQSTSQTFTPHYVVKLMIDQLETCSPGVFANTTNKFIDPYMKSGMFITEIARRLFSQTRARYHSDHDCIRHILEHQVYGLAPTPLLAAITNNYIFGFDAKHTISHRNFREHNIINNVKRRQFASVLGELFNLKGEAMKFTAIVGNPPYQEDLGKTADQVQGNTSWIYQYFQRSADQIAEYTCLIYPFGGWFDSPNRMGGFGRQLLGDGHTAVINAFEGTIDRRSWYRSDRDPEPIFGQDTDLSAGVAVVLRDLTREHTSFQFSNRMYSDDLVRVSCCDAEQLTSNPAFFEINRKLTGPKLNSRIKKNFFGIESSFVERNPKKVSLDSDDWKHPILLLANDKSGPTGRVQRYWTDSIYIPKNHDYLDYYKVVMISAYPKKTIIAGKPTIKNIQDRARELIELLPQGSAFGRSRLALFMSKNKRECENFLKYTQTQFFAALLLQEPNRSSSFGSVILDQDFSESSDIDWSLDVDKIDKILCDKYKLTPQELKTLGIEV